MGHQPAYPSAGRRGSQAPISMWLVDILYYMRGRKVNHQLLNLEMKTAPHG